MDLRGFKEHVDQFLTYLEVEKNVSDHTLRAYKSDLAQLTEFWSRILHTARDAGDVGKKILTVQRVFQRFVRSLYFKKIAKTSLARKLSSIRSFVRYLKNEGVKITLDMKSPRLNRKLPSILSVDEIFFLLDGIKGADLPTRYPCRDKAIFELLYATGVRCSELVNMKLSDIDLAKKSVVVLGKGRKSRIVLFGKKAKSVLEKYLKGERTFLVGEKNKPFLFLNYSGGQLTSRSVQRVCTMFQKFLKTERKLSPHKIRHSFATHLLNQGVDLRVVQELLGHKTLSSTQIYTHVSSRELAKMCDEKHPLNQMDNLLSDE